MSNFSPYQPPPPAYPEQQMYQGGNLGSLRLGRMFGFVTESPNWVANVALSAVAVLLSGVVVGQLVLYGYVMTIARREAEAPGSQYPDFDMNNIGDYLIKGLWVWLGMLLFGGIFGILLMVVVVLFGGIIAAIGGPEGENGGIAIVMAIALYGVIILGSLLIQVALIPVALRVGISESFAEIFNFRWHMDFFRRCGGSIILGGIVFVLGSMLFGIVGMLLCFIGYFPALGWIQMAAGNFLGQLYRLYLERGGEPIPLPARG